MYGCSAWRDGIPGLPVFRIKGFVEKPVAFQITKSLNHEQFAWHVQHADISHRKQAEVDLVPGSASQQPGELVRRLGALHERLSQRGLVEVFSRTSSFTCRRDRASRRSGPRLSGGRHIPCRKRNEAEREGQPQQNPPGCGVRPSSARSARVGHRGRRRRQHEGQGCHCGLSARGHGVRRHCDRAAQVADARPTGFVRSLGTKTR